MTELLQINLFCMKASRFNFSLAMIKELEKTKHSKLFKLCICGEKHNIELWNTYFQNNKPNIKIELVTFNDSFYPSKVNFVQKTKCKYICKMDDDIFMSHVVWDYVLENLDKISSQHPVIAPIFTNGIPSVGLFIEDFLNESEKIQAHQLLKMGRINPHEWGLNYSKVNEYIHSVNEWDDKLFWKFMANVDTNWDKNPVPWYYYMVRGVHPARYSFEYNMFIANCVINKREKFMEPNNMFLDTYFAPYFCNNLFFTETKFYKDSYNLFYDGWDEGQLTLKMGLDNSCPLYIRNGFAIHMAYGMTAGQQQIENFYISNFLK